MSKFGAISGDESARRFRAEACGDDKDADAFPGACPCAWKGCVNAGEYRAPKDRQLQEYFRFCLEHVRAYNANWDYHAGYSVSELEAEIRSASTWERPTWKLGTLGAGFRPSRMHVHDPFGFATGTEFDAEAWNERVEARQRQREQSSPAQTAAQAAQAKALKVFDLTKPLTLEVLKQRYIALVKKHHPDANGGSHEAESRMKIINQAYQTLREALASSS